MRTVTDHEKRLIRRATIAIAIYLAVFCGFKMWQSMHHRRTEYVQLVKDAKDLKLKVEKYQVRADVVKQMMQDYHLDPAKLSRATIVGEASSAIQKAAASSGVGFSTVRESNSRG